MIHNHLMAATLHADTFNNSTTDDSLQLNFELTLVNTSSKPSVCLLDPNPTRLHKEVLPLIKA